MFAFYVVLGLRFHFQERKRNVTRGTVCTLYLTEWKCIHLQRLSRVLQCQIYYTSVSGKR